MRERYASTSADSPSEFTDQLDMIHDNLNRISSSIENKQAKSEEDILASKQCTENLQLIATWLEWVRNQHSESFFKDIHAEIGKLKVR